MKQIWQEVRRSADVLRAAGILLLTIAAYLPALRGGFIWDDDAHLTENPCIVGPLGFKEIWTSSAATYYPLVLTSFWVQHALWGLNPLPYHLVNIIVHALCAVLLWRTLVDLKAPGAWLSAMLWAVHPVQVESVAWITELKNTQSCLFYLLAIQFFIRWRNADVHSAGAARLVNYLLVLLFAVCAVLSKSSTVMLPVILALCAWWMEGRLRWRTVASLIPLVVISAAVSGWTIWEQQFHSGATGEEWNQSLVERTANAGRAVWFYLGKLLWPHPLIFIYPRWSINTARLDSFLPILTVTVGLLILWFYRHGRARALFFSSACFVVSLFPVMGFFNVYFFRYSFVGDHFQYLASMAPLALAGAVLVGTASLFRWRFAAPAMSGTLIIVLAVLTWKHTTVFRNNETLWRHTLARNPGAWLAHTHLGSLQLKRGDFDGAIRHFKSAIRLSPRSSEGYLNLGKALVELGKIDEAVEQYRVALRREPDSPDIHNALGAALVTQGRTPEAVEHFRSALDAGPAIAAMAQHNLGGVAAMLEKPDEAMEHFKEALRLDPRRLNTRMQYAETLAKTGRNEEAIAQYSEALRLAPRHAAAQKSLADLLFVQGRNSEAKAHYMAAIAGDSANWGAHFQLAVILAAEGDKTGAIDHFRAGIRLKPEWFEPLNGLAWLLATDPDPKLRDGAVALECAERAARLSEHKNPFVLDTLAAAYAESGRFAEAVSTAQKAIDLATASGNGTLAAAIVGRLGSYKRGQAHRE